MQNKRLEILSELALIRALPDMITDTRKIKKSRLGNIYKRLQKHVDKRLRTLLPFTKADDVNVKNRIMSFAAAAGWEKKEHDVMKLLSFVLGIIDESEFNYPARIIGELNAAFEHMTTKYPPGELNGCFVDADTAIAIWKRRF